SSYLQYIERQPATNKAECVSIVEVEEAPPSTSETEPNGAKASPEPQKEEEEEKPKKTHSKRKRLAKRSQSASSADDEDSGSFPTLYYFQIINECYVKQISKVLTVKLVTSRMNL